MHHGLTFRDYMTEILNFPIKELTLLENNPRTISKDQFDKLCKSIKDDPAFLWNRPVLVNVRQKIKGKQELIYEVYAGNQRVQAAKKLKWKEIPCCIDENLPEELIKQRIIKDNAHYGRNDWDELANSYDVSTLLYAGYEESDIIGNSDIEEILEEEKPEKKKKCKMCPNCGFEL